MQLEGASAAALQLLSVCEAHPSTKVVPLCESSPAQQQSQHLVHQEKVRGLLTSMIVTSLRAGLALALASWWGDWSIKVTFLPSTLFTTPRVQKPVPPPTSTTWCAVRRCNQQCRRHSYMMVENALPFCLQPLHIPSCMRSVLLRKSVICCAVGRRTLCMSAACSGAPPSGA